MKTFLSCLYYFIVVTISVLVMSIMFVIWMLTMPLGKKANTYITCRLRRVWFAISYWTGWFWGWRIKVEGKENLPQGACIIMSNHQGYYDIPIFLCLDKTVKWVAKKEVAKMPIVGQVLHMCGDILLDRKSGASAKHMIELCKKNLDMGVTMVIYPEGTRTKTGDIGSFKAGGFLMAKQCGYPIVPAVISGNWECFRGGKVKLGCRFALKILPHITAEEVENTDIKTMMTRTEQTIREQYETLRHIND